MNQIKGALQKIKKRLHRQHSKKYRYIQSDYFIFTIYLPKQNQKAINPHPGNQKGNEKRLQKTPTKKTSKGV